MHVHACHVRLHAALNLRALHLIMVYSAVLCVLYIESWLHLYFGLATKGMTLFYVLKPTVTRAR